MHRPTPERTADVLARILSTKRTEVAARSTTRPLAEMRAMAEAAAPVRGFAQALQQQAASGAPAVIAEIKKASPSRGRIRASCDPAAIARSYATGGATCLSVLTDAQYFQGTEDDLIAARSACNLPILRKDFMISPWQIWESRALGADCVLLIVAALEDAQLVELSETAATASLDVLVEVHNATELQRALALPTPLIGINNRDLHTFETSLDTSLKLSKHLPASHLAIAESGIHTREDVRRLRDAGIHAFLVGEACMRAEDPGSALRQLFG